MPATLNVFALNAKCFRRTESKFYFFFSLQKSHRQFAMSQSLTQGKIIPNHRQHEVVPNNPYGCDFIAFIICYPESCVRLRHQHPIIIPTPNKKPFHNKMNSIFTTHTTSLIIALTNQSTTFRSSETTTMTGNRYSISNNSNI